MHGNQHMNISMLRRAIYPTISFTAIISARITTAATTAIPKHPKRMRPHSIEPAK